MRKSAVIGIVVALVVIAVVVALVATHKSTTPTSTSSTMNMAPATKPATSAQPTATDAVTIQNFSFSPSVITVKKGTTVTWTNSDSVTHTVTETDGKTGPNSGNLDPTKTYSFTYNTVGSFAYHCSIHPNMVGEVVVTD